MTWLNKRPPYADYLLMVLGSGCLAFGILCMYTPAGLVTGGFSGIAIIVRQISILSLGKEIPLWLTNFVLNIPVFLVAFLVKGADFVKRTGFAACMLSVWLYILPTVDMTEQDPMLAAIYGGVLSGIGLGLVLLAKATTGGTDLMAVLIQHKLRHYSVVQILQLIDGLIVVAGLFVFGVKTGLYAVIAIYITSKVSDTLMEGMKFSKAAFIITDLHEKVAGALMEQLNRGVTGLYAKGMYSDTEKCLLYCVVSKKEIVDLKEIVVKIDPSAFVIVSDAREVLGEGFLEYTKI